MNSTNKHNNPLSREDISQYMSTKDERLKNSIERKATQSDFENDALDGWAGQSILISNMDRLDKKFGSTKGVKIIITSIIAASAIVISVLFLVPLAETEGQKSMSSTETPVQLSFEKSDIVIPEHIDSMVVLPKNKSIQPKSIQKEFKEKVATPTTIEQSKNNIESDLKIADLPLLKIDRPKNERLVTSSAAKEIYLSELKLVDYREYRSRPMIQTKTMTLSGVPANMEHASSTQNEVEWTVTEIAYYDYIKKTQEIFYKENYKKALTRYLTILETYSDDVNALFYSGLCYYNLAQYTSANEQFFRCLGSKFNNFNEEAEWFMAQSYLASGERQKAKSIFEMIVEKNGYYAGQAKEVVRKM